MKYMLWSDLKPGDVLQFTDEYLSYCGEKFMNKFQNKDLIIFKIIYEKDYIRIYIDYFFSLSLLIMMEQLVVVE